MLPRKVDLGLEGGADTHTSIAKGHRLAYHTKLVCSMGLALQAQSEPWLTL